MENETYPAEWDALAKAQTEDKDRLDIAGGQSARVAVLQGPYGYGQLFFDKAPVEGSKKRAFDMPLGTKIPGYKIASKFIFEVFVLQGTQQGQHLTWSTGKKINEQLLPVQAEYGKDFANWPDLIVSRKGTGKEDTVWTVTAGKKSGERPAPELDLRGKVRFATPEELGKLPQATAGSAKGAGVDMSQPISPKQIDFINDLRTQKEMTKKEVEKIALRKFEESDIDKLSSGQASQLIDTLKAL
jgi:hypothetical protein